MTELDEAYYEGVADGEAEYHAEVVRLNAEVERLRARLDNSQAMLDDYTREADAEIRRLRAALKAITSTTLDVEDIRGFARDVLS